MKSIQYSALAVALPLALTVLVACGGKDDNALLLPMLAQASTSTAGEVPGGTSAPTTDSNAGGQTVTLPGGGSTSTSGSTGSGSSASTETSTGSSSVVLPAGAVNQTTAPGGDFTGVTFNSSSPELSGFVSIIVSGTSTTAAQIGNALVSTISGNASFAGATVVSSQQASGASDTQLLNLQVTTNSSMTVTQVSNLIIQLFGTNIQGGTVTALPVGDGEATSTQFRVVVQITFGTNNDALLGVGVTTEAGYANAESLLVGMLDGTNVAPAGSTKETLTNVFNGAGAPKADFLFIVDNSGSMQQEQTAVSNVASNFFDRMNSSSTDFKIGVITTDSATIRSPGFTGVKTEFQTAIAAGTNGSPSESGLHFGVQALSSGGSVVTAGFPRQGSSLSIVILSDEGDHYACYNGGSRQSGADPCNGGTDLNTSDNLFTGNKLRVYTIIGLASGGNPGTCTGSNGTSATNSNNAWPAYYDVSQATGGASSSICSNDFSAFLNIIATQGVGAASAYQLTKTPISNSIAVMVNGTQVNRSSENGYVYDSVSNSLIFSGTAIPPVGSAISVSYDYYVENQSSGIAAALFQAGGRNMVMLLGITLVAMAALGAILLMRRREQRAAA